MVNRVISHKGSGHLELSSGQCIECEYDFVERIRITVVDGNLIKGASMLTGTVSVDSAVSIPAGELILLHCDRDEPFEVDVSPIIGARGEYRLRRYTKSRWT